MLMVGGFVGMNLLSGVTWKGAQLRLGEATPDFRERCVLLLLPLPFIH